jgi:NAD(P)H dehydrogenase (quinone)
MNKTKSALIIIGHPSKKSMSHRLAASFAQGLEAKGHEYQIIDLYNDTTQLPISHYQDYSDWSRDDEIRKIFQEKIASADTLAFFHPIWWGGMPPLLKNFIDQTLTPGFAYKYTKKSWLPDKLNIMPDGYLGNKKARIFITYDAYTIVYAFVGFPFVTIWAIFILFYCGIKNMRFTLHARVKWSDEQKRQKWLDRAKKIGSRI